MDSLHAVLHYCRKAHTINMNDAGLEGGTLAPLEVGIRQHLKVLNLSENSLTGPLPSFKGCPNLRVLDLHQNAFTYHPDTGLDLAESLPQLEELRLNNNDFSGACPDLSASPSLR